MTSSIRKYRSLIYCHYSNKGSRFLLCSWSGQKSVKTEAKRRNRKPNDVGPRDRAPPSPQTDCILLDKVPIPNLCRIVNKILLLLCSFADRLVAVR
jgi:hypothetical protein